MSAVGFQAAGWVDALRPSAPVLVTGAAGFIGFHLSERLLAAGVAVHGVDSLTAHYDPRLKDARLERLRSRPGFAFTRLDLADRAATGALFEAVRPSVIAHLAAQAGVRHSIDAPHAFVDSNLVAFLNVLEGCRAVGARHLVYASSSSVYGGNRKLPFAADDQVDHPVSLYAATKKANELMAHAYAHLYGLPCTGLRFFTVYGPWGRPDMAYWLFAEAIAEGRPIRVFNDGQMTRDFTYIDDVVEAMCRLLPVPAAADPTFDAAAPAPSASWAPYRLFNIGNHRRETLMDMIAILERALGREAVKTMLPMQPGDVVETWADVSPLQSAIGWTPDTKLADGLGRFVAWYNDWRGGV